MTESQYITQEAIQKVEDNNREYYEKAFSFAEVWIKTQMKPFTSEDLKRDFYNKGNPPPIEPRVFGAVFNRLSKEGRIKRKGFEKSKNPTCHSRPQSIWISLEYSAKQQQNRKTFYPSLFQEETNQNHE